MTFTSGIRKKAGQGIDKDDIKALYDNSLDILESSRFDGITVFKESTSLSVGVSQEIVWDSAVINPNSWTVSSENVIIPSSVALVQISFCFTFSSGSDFNNILKVGVRNNGTIDPGFPRKELEGGYGVSSGSGIVAVSAADEITLQFLNENAGGAAFSIENIYLSVLRIKR